MRLSKQHADSWSNTQTSVTNGSKFGMIVLKHVLNIRMANQTWLAATVGPLSMFHVACLHLDWKWVEPFTIIAKISEMSIS